MRSRTVRSPEVDRIIQQVIVERGMSYESAARWCEEQAEDRARAFKAAAAEIRGWLSSPLVDERDST